jgi:diacylglycerol kinase
MAPFEPPGNPSLLRSTITAARGFYDAVRTEHKIRWVVLAAVAVTAICVIADVGYFQILMIIFSWVVALICEMFNTALEKALDLASGKEYHPLVRAGKDYAAACTFVAIVFAGSLALFVIAESARRHHIPVSRQFAEPSQPGA